MSPRLSVLIFLLLGLAIASPFQQSPEKVKRPALPPVWGKRRVEGSTVHVSPFDGSIAYNKRVVNASSNLCEETRRQLERTLSSPILSQTRS